jgi:hypothetical protein
MGRGMNACKEYHNELRRAFRIRNEKDTAKAKLKFNKLEIRTKLMTDALESAEAKAFLEQCQLQSN